MRELFLIPPISAAFLPLGPVMAQSMPGMVMPPDQTPPRPSTPSQMPMAMDDAVSTSGSGTSRLPGNDAMHGVQMMAGDWMLMVHANAWGSWTNQGGPRRARQACVQSLTMLEAVRPPGEGAELTLRSMLSGDPLMGERGYPDLFASGETAQGIALVDRQHPHGLFMKVGSGRRRGGHGPPSACLWRPHRRARARTVRVLAPRFGAVRPRGADHTHWFGSSHFAWDVVTAAHAMLRWQIEVSAFKGREPDENRYNIETPRLDSWSICAT